MDGAMNRIPSLWVHQESTIIRADSHDVWSFTPEFLLVNEIVPDNWLCQRAKRTGNVMDIQYGPIYWRMTESDLWITHYPDCPIEDRSSIEDRNPVPAMAESYLEKVPHFPFRSLLFYWRVSAANPNPHQWMLDNFLHKGWPEEFRITKIQPVLHFSSDNTAFQITVRDEPSQRQHETIQDSIIFDCYAYQTQEQMVGDMVLETDHWFDRWDTLERAINHLLEEGTS